MEYEYDPFAEDPATITWSTSASMPMASANGMGYTSSAGPAASGPWNSMQLEQQQEFPSGIPQTYPQEPQPVGMQLEQQQQEFPTGIPQAYQQEPQPVEYAQQYSMGQGNVFNYGNTDPQQQAYPPPPDLLGEPGVPETYRLDGAAQSAVQWTGGTAAPYGGTAATYDGPTYDGTAAIYDGSAATYNNTAATNDSTAVTYDGSAGTYIDGMGQPSYATSYDGMQPPYDSMQAPYSLSMHGGSDVTAQPQPQSSVRGAVAAAKQYALEMAASGVGGSGSRRSRGRSHSRSRSRERDRHRGRRDRSRSDSRERRYVRRRSRDRSERGRRSRPLEDEDIRGRGRSIDQDAEWGRGRSIDQDSEWGSRNRWRGRSGSREPQEPTPTVFIKGIPDISTEEDLQILLSPFPNVTSVRLVKNKETGMHRGFAFIDFASAADAARFMEPAQRNNHVLGGSRLYTEFTTPSQFVTAGAEAAARGGAMHAESRGVAAVPVPPLDWVCDMCQAVNFARRLECYQCSSPRPAVPKRVQMDTEGPSTILKVSGLSEDATEEGLRFIFSVHMPVMDVRLVRDKFSGAPRGFAFVELGSIADATRAHNQLQNFVPEFQATPIRLCYARDRGGAQPAASSAALPFEAIQEMQELSGWAPKEFTEGEDAEAKEEEQRQQQQAAGATAATAGSSGASASTSQPSGTSGYIYDEASGYYYDPVSGSHYDGNTGYFYFPTTQQWCMYDQASGQYIPVSASASANAGPSTAAHAALATTENAVAAQRSASAGTAPQGAKGNRSKGAVIGAKPQYNSQGLLAAVQQLSEKEAQQKALAQQKATVASKPQVSKPPQVNPNSKAANPSANPGLGMMGPAQQRQAQQPQAQNSQQAQQQQAQQQQQQQVQQAQQQQVQQQQQAADAAAVTGKIYRSKWSQRH